MSDILSKAKDFMYRNARLIDRKRYEYHFEGGPNVEVINALRVYQNEDGGFGNALEPDIRCPQSQPVPTEVALAIMDEVNYFDPDIVKGITEYLQSITLQDGGLPFVLTSASHYPHAPWWKTESDDKPSINPTGNILGLLYKQKAGTTTYDEAWFKKSEQYVWRCLENEVPSGYHDLIQLITFLEHTPDKARAKQHWPKVNAVLERPGTIERDAYATGYVQKVLDWCPSASSYARRFVAEEDIEAHLQALISQQQEDGGWPINWQAISPGTETEWRGWVTMDRLLTLRSYGVI